MITTTRAELDLERLDAALPTAEFATVLLRSSEPRLVITARRDVCRCVEVFVDADDPCPAYWFGGDSPSRILGTQLPRMAAALIGRVLDVY